MVTTKNQTPTGYPTHGAAHWYIVDQWHAARELHACATRYSYDDGMTSRATEPEARADYGDDWTDDVDLHTFTICVECGRVEMENGREDYLESLWPCPTARALGATTS